MGRFSHFTKGNLSKLLSLPRYAAGAVRSLWTRRDPKLWVIGSGFGVSDGALAFARAAQALDPGIRFVWLTGSDTEAAAATKAGFEHVARDSADGLQTTLRAGAVIVTHGFGDANRYGQRGAVIVQLWHGPPIKKIRADSPAVTATGIPGMGAVMRFLYRAGSSQISLLPAIGRAVVPHFQSAFNLRQQVRVLGEPREDVLFRGAERDRIAASRALWDDLLGLKGKVVLYAPTWRNGDVDEGIPTADEWRLIDETCERLDAYLVIRPHQLGVGEYSGFGARVRLLPPGAQPDVMPLLWGVDALISDYSSLLVYYSVTAQPMVFFAPDLEDYAATRGLYYDYDELSAGHTCRTWAQALARLEEVLTDPAPARKLTRVFRDHFHAYADDQSARRVAEATAELVAKRFPGA
ncbi:MAG: CDP-glycerol glycerophosphotransferase family protein [Bifidobacteriaceae bacterium]|jgi:CDP-glycerol glycerophosphotransferase|nr:CDP-glycerol glycerophosphotransferase family protein [Bifidobacteriaceae bacterium]